MKEFTLFCVLTAIFSYTADRFGVWDNLKETADKVHTYEKKALKLAMEVRHLKAKNTKLQQHIITLESKLNVLSSKNVGSQASRKIASVNPEDLVQFDLYKWSEEQLLDIAERAIHFNKANKASQHYHALITHYPKSKLITDDVLFAAASSAFDAKKYKWAKQHWSSLVKTYPNQKASKHFRASKAWLAIAHYYNGDKEKFVAGAKEMRTKYRNFREGKLVAKFWEDIAAKYGEDKL